MQVLCIERGVKDNYHDTDKIILVPRNCTTEQMHVFTEQLANVIKKITKEEVYVDFTNGDSAISLDIGQYVLSNNPIKVLWHFSWNPEKDDEEVPEYYVLTEDEETEEKNEKELRELIFSCLKSFCN